MSVLEAQLRRAWNARPRHAYTVCAGCKEMKHCTGKRRNAMTCLTCFDARGGK